VYQDNGQSIWETEVWCALAENALCQGDLATARIHLQAASRLLGTSDNKWLQALVSYFRGLLAYYEGDAVAAMMLLQQSTALAREGQHKPELARSLVALGRVKRTLGQILPASELLLEGLELSRALGDKLGIAEALEELGVVSAVQGDGVHAAMLFGTAHALREGMGAPLPPVDRAAHGSVVAVCRAQLGETAFAAAWAHAAARPFQEVVDEVLRRFPYTQ
jgi:ATP/maltotriose-dependent transcriptional regulator MalT